MKFKNPWISATERLLTKDAEHALYEKAANDIESNIIYKGIWTKAFSLTNGDEKKQKAKYIELMVEYYKDLILAGEELENIIKRKDEIQRQEDIKASEKKSREARRIEDEESWGKARKKREQYLNSPAYKEKRKKIVVTSIFLFSAALLFFLNLVFPKKMTYECGSGEIKEIVIIESDFVVRNETTGRNSYNMLLDEENNSNFIVYILWQSISREGYMYKKDTKELAQLEPKQLCRFIGEKRF